ncbi:MAG TPA: hypothetical protein VFT27_11470, partial [Actinomycetota bacterium]|nr:hypothetical protein [Actinomycetota bacterium]
MRKTLVLVTFCALALASCGGDPQDGERRTPSAPTTAPAAAFSPGQSGSPAPIASPSPIAPTGPEWRRAIPFWARAIATDAEGAVYVTGSVEYGRAQPWGRSWAMVLERSDADGHLLWTRRWKSRDEWYMNAIGFDVT